jgi:hypothetical protein
MFNCCQYMALQWDTARSKRGAERTCQPHRYCNDVWVQKALPAWYSLRPNFELLNKRINYQYLIIFYQRGS